MDDCDDHDDKDGDGNDDDDGIHSDTSESWQFCRPGLSPHPPILHCLFEMF